MPEDDNSIPPSRNKERKDRLVARLKAGATLATAVAGLATAVFKPADTTATRAAYQQTVLAVEKLNAAAERNHDDIVALRGYVAAKTGEVLIPATPVTSTGTADAGAPAPHAALPTHGGGAGKPAMHTITLEVAAGPATTSEPPPVAPAPPVFHPADFDTVLKSAK